MNRNVTAETKILRIIKRAGKPLQAYQIVKQMGWQYPQDATKVVMEMADAGQITRTWDEQGNVFYSS